MEPKFIDTPAALEKFLGDLGESDGQPPRLYVDLEGNNLSRNGTLSLITVLLEPEKDVYLIDVTTLGRDTFITTDANDRSLRSVMESPDIIKVFFDIRNDSDALYGLYGIRVEGIEDLQLMELASRPSGRRRNVNGLARCIEREDAIDISERRQWQTVKDKGKDLFDPNRGGSYAVFDQRPLSEDMKRYCTQDVTFMPHLRKVYRERLCDAWWRKIEAETNARIQFSQSPAFNGKGKHMALAPTGWLSWNPTLTEKFLRTLLQEVPARGTQAQKPSAEPLNYHPIPSQSHEVDELADMVRKVAMTGSSHDLDNDDDDYEDFVGTYNRYQDFYDDNSSGDRDFTACDKECGYCGHCDY